MRIQFWARTDVGRKRAHNEDNFLVDKKLNLYVVCDGMGGHASGEVASATAVKEVHEKISANRDIIERFLNNEPGVDNEDVRTLIEHAVEYACFKIYEMGQKDKKKRGMGTTLSLILILGERCFIGHVGDSRIYLVRKGEISLLTKDHSLLNELIERGKVKTEKDIKFPFKNAVTRAVGVFENVDVDVYEYGVEEGDYYLLCSDGLHGYYEDEALLPFLSEEKPETWVDNLIDAANEAGGKDNITAVVIKVLTPSEAGHFDATQKKIDTLKLIPLFKYLSYKELVRVLEVTSERTFEPDLVLFNDGDEGDCLYIVLSGQVEIRKNDVVLASLGAGLHFGEMALIDKVPRSAEARALTRVETMVFTRDQFFDLLRNDAALAVKLLWSFVRTLSARLRSTSDELAMIRALDEDVSLDEDEILRRQSTDHVVATPGTLSPPEPPELDPQFDDYDDIEEIEEEETLLDPDEVSEAAELIGEISSDVMKEDAVARAAEAAVERENSQALLEDALALATGEEEEIELDDEEEFVSADALEALTQLVEQEKSGGSLDQEVEEVDTREESGEALAALTQLVEQERELETRSTVEMELPKFDATEEEEGESDALAALNRLVEDEKSAQLDQEEADRVSLGISVASAEPAASKQATQPEVHLELAEIEEVNTDRDTVEMRIDPKMFEMLAVDGDVSGKAVVSLTSDSEIDADEESSGIDVIKPEDLRRKTIEQPAIAFEISDDDKTVEGVLPVLEQEADKPAEAQATGFEPETELTPEPLSLEDSVEAEQGESEPAPEVVAEPESEAEASLETPQSEPVPAAEVPAEVLQVKKKKRRRKRTGSSTLPYIFVGDIEQYIKEHPEIESPDAKK